MGGGPPDEAILDAVLFNLQVIGEAAQSLPFHHSGLPRFSAKEENMMFKLMLILSLVAGVGRNGMLQIGGKDKQGAVLDGDHDLVGILSREFHDRRPDDAGLTSWVVKIYGVGAVLCANVVDSAQEVVGVTMNPVVPTFCQYGGPTSP